MHKKLRTPSDTDGEWPMAFVPLRIAALGAGVGSLNLMFSLASNLANATPTQIIQHDPRKGTIMVNVRKIWRAALAFVLVTASALGTACAEPVGRNSAAKLCVLKPGDFRTFGTVVALPTANTNEGPQSAYCVYRGGSGATGGVELDVFFPAGEQPSDVEQTFKTTMAESPGAIYSPEGVPGADESQFSLAVPQSGFAPFAANSVRRGDLVFCLSLPASPVAKDELLALSKLVLERLAR